MNAHDPSRTPRAVKASERLAPPDKQTPNIRREEAFAGKDRWIGYVTTQPGEWSGWHHHGEQDTYFYVLRGRLEFEYGREGATARVETGDFGYVPSGVVHRERTAPGEPGEAVLVRVGTGPGVVNVDGPE
jgi:uncharacterized RmlC-like cupin family protein